MRAPAHPLAQAVLAAFGRPVVAPSANRSGRPSPTTFADAVAETGAAAAVALDGGACAIGLESTVVALLDGPPRLLRPGAVTRAEIEALIGPLAEAEADAARSPGRLARHYAPDAPLRLDADAPRAGRGLPRVRPGAGRPARLQPQPEPATCAEAAARLFSPSARRRRAAARPPSPSPRSPTTASAKRSTTACAAPPATWADAGARGGSILEP